jgi:DNA repair protein RecN (Recombination protein N)
MINEQPVSLQILRKLGDYLVDIHGQHAHQSLLKHDVQRQLLDETIENDLLTQVYQAYQHWKVLQTELNYLGGNTQDREARVALLHYQVQELEALELTSDSIQQLEEEHRRLANVTKLLENSQHALTLLDAEEANSTLSYLTQASHALQEAQQHDEQLGGVTALLDNAMVQTQEAVSELRHYLRRLEIDPARLQWVEQRITKLHDIARKHKVHFSDLPDYFERLSTQLAELQNYEQRAEQLSVEVAQALKDYQQIAERLHDQRLIAAQRLSTRISENIQRLGMSVGQVVITVTADEHASPTATGMDIVEFLVSTNPGHSPKPLHKIASGGELSRISLAIQVITAQNSGTPTLIFDEVDVGIGGAVAETVGQLLNQLGQQRQVLCITHLPQVACQGDHHLQVNKTIQQQATHTDIKPLNEQERVEEIARMLGGLEITPQTLVYAREMLQRRKQA